MRPGWCIAALLVGMIAACREPTRPPATDAAATPRASDPVLARGLLVSGPHGGPNTIAYVALLPHTIQAAAAATITNVRSGLAVSVPISNGGFDPRRIDANAGDTIVVAAEQSTQGGGGESAYAVVVAGRHPRIVRTEPTSGSVGLPVDASIRVVFSDAVDPSTVTGAAFVLRADSGAIAHSARILPDSEYEVAVIPDAPLALGMSYALVVSTIANVSGDQLADGAEVDFATAPAPLTVRAVRVAMPHQGFATCALDVEGRAYCWGENGRNILGVDAVRTDQCEDPDLFTPLVDCVLTPAPVRGDHRFRAITMGFSHACGLTADGDAWCWGDNGLAQLGSGTEGEIETSPVHVSGPLKFQQIVAGVAFTCGLAAGQAYCWGTSDFGTPRGVPSGGPTLPETRIATPTVISGAEVFTSLAAGDLHVCGLTSDGRVYCWGMDEYGQLGVATAPDSCVYDPCSLTPVPVQGGLRFKAISAGWLHTCGVTVSDETYCWGLWRPTVDNAYNWSAVPTRVPGGRVFRSLSLGFWGASCGLTDSGKAWCWGRTIFGPGGETPVPVASGFAFSNLVQSVSDYCGIGIDHELYCWGGNWTGEVGIGTMAVTDSPVRVQLPPP